MPGAAGTLSGALSGQFPCVCVQYVFICICFSPHLKQITDFKPDQTLLWDKINVHNLVSWSLHPKAVKISCFLMGAELQSKGKRNLQNKGIVWKRVMAMQGVQAENINATFPKISHLCVWRTQMA